MDSVLRTLTDGLRPAKRDTQQSMIALGSKSVWRRIRRAIEVVDEAWSAAAAGDIRRAASLCRSAERGYIAILSELTRLSRKQAELVEPAFTELEVRLRRLSKDWGAEANQNRCRCN